MKSLTVKIKDPLIIQALKDIAEVRNIREKNEEIKCHWTSESVAISWLANLACGINRSPETICEYIRRYPSFDWEDVDELRAKRQELRTEI